MKKKSFRSAAALCLAALLCCLSTVFFPFAGSQAAGNKTSVSEEKEQELMVTFLDVGQGDAAVVQCGGQNMMIDGGKAEASSFVYSWLKKNGISQLDYMVATHPDADHIGGLSGALNYAKVKTAYCSVKTGSTKTFQSFVKYLGKQDVAITVPKAGSSFMLGDASVQILGPEKASDDTNNSSIVLRITYGKTSFLFTGDAEREEEQELLDSGYDLHSTVLKVGHHGSDSSTSYHFLREVSPEYAVISVGEDNSYGHPTEAVLSRLRDAQVKTYRTDMQGTITAVSDGEKVHFQTEKNADADTLQGAGAGQNAAKSSVQAGEAAGGAASRKQQTGAADKSAAGAADAQTYVLNTNTHKFHDPSCSSVDQMKEKNKKVVTASREELIAQGYAPCGRCHP